MHLPDKQSWERISDVFTQALEQPSSQWKTWVNNHLSEKEKKQGMDTYILKLLIKAPRADAFFEALQRNVEDDLCGYEDEINYQQGERIGKFRIIKELGHGGMARVYLCERADDQFEHKVAVKVMKVQGDIDFSKERFRQEQQILAGINHPNIAQLYDGGFTDEGFPFIVMEYIEGMPIDEYCADKKLTVSEKLRLFQQVCAAIQYAHNQFIIHQDIKPANILVNKDGLVKLLDFGIARLHKGASVKETDQGKFAGTLHYASPEQFEGAAPSVASDIYKLGLLLFKILTGENYFGQAYMHTSENQPSRTLIKKKLSVYETLKQESSLVLDDLSVLLHKALAPHPEDRFVTVNALQHDIHNHLAAFPLHAHPSSMAYHLKKRYLRNKTKVWLLLGFNLALLILLAFFFMQYFETVREKERSGQILQFVWEIFDSVDPDHAQGEDITAMQLLEASIGRIALLEDQPFLQSELYLVTGQLTSRLGYWDRTRELYLQSLAALPERSDSRHYLQRATILKDLSGYYLNVSEYRTSDSIMDEALAFLDKSGRNARAVRPEFLVQKANILRYKGELEEALALVSQGIVLYDKSHNSDLEDLLEAYNIKASCYREMEKMEDALRVQSRAWEMTQEMQPGMSGIMLSTLNNLAIIQGRVGDTELALENSHKHWEMQKKIYGSYHPGTLRSLNNLASAYQRAGEMEVSDSIFILVAGLFETHLGPMHEYTVAANYNLANSFYQQQNYPLALSYYYKALEADKVILGENHPLVAYDYNSLGMVYMELKEHDKAEKKYRIAEKLFRENFGDEHATIARIYFYLGELYNRMGNTAKSFSYLNESVAMAEQLLGENHENTKRYRQKLAALEENLIAKSGVN